MRPAGATAAAATAVAPPDNSTNTDRCRLELVGSRRPKCHDALAGGGFGPYLIVLDKGTFEMGSKVISQEGPVHPVTIAKPFAIAEHEASQGEYQAFCTQTRRACEAQPWTGEDYPVVKVSWQDARDYAAWLSSATGFRYRLATEAEWEYAARGGTAALYPQGEALGQTDAVYSFGEKLSAPWRRAQRINAAHRLFNTIGNVREWVEDPWSPGLRRRARGWIGAQLRRRLAARGPWWCIHGSRVRSCDSRRARAWMPRRAMRSRASE